MTIPQISTERPHRSPEVKLVLRNGQIVHGKVNKIYPNNRAEIQIGSTRVTAEIVAPLDLEKNYIFQVQQKGAQLIHLKVLGEHHVNRAQQNVSELLQQLNIKINRHHLQFTQMLIDEKVPFTQRQLVDALQLLGQTGFSKANRELLLTMILDRKPITNEYLQAMLAVRNTSISSALTEAQATLQNMNQTETTDRALRFIESLLQRTDASYINVTAGQQESIRSTLQLFQYLSRQHHVATSGTQQQLANSEQQIQEHMRAIFSELVRASANESVRNDLLQIVRHSQSLQSSSMEILQKFPLLQTGSINVEHFAQLKEQIQRELIPLLPKQMQSIFQNLLAMNHADNQRNLYQILQSFQSNEFYSLLLETSASHHHQTETMRQEPVLQARFIQHVQQFIQLSGLTNEATLKTLLLQSPELVQELNLQQSSLKSMILQAMQDEPIQADRLQQLVHFLNGMQLQAKESNNLMQVFLQLPGNKLNTLKDVSIEFTGRKTEDGNIDADFCRILFVLHLEHIKETIIDMNVQKRVVTLTIYNHHSDQLEKMMQPLKKILEQNLQSLNFHLSHVRFRSMKEQEQKEVFQERKEVNDQNRQEGFDLFI